jgi:ferredoxin
MEVRSFIRRAPQTLRQKTAISVAKPGVLRCFILVKWFVDNNEGTKPASANLSIGSHIITKSRCRHAAGFGGTHTSTHHTNGIFRALPDSLDRMSTQLAASGALGSRRRQMKCAHCFQCDSCGSTDICRSRRHGVVEWMLRFIAIRPWRCMNCDYRFLRFCLRSRPVKLRNSHTFRPSAQLINLVPNQKTPEEKRKISRLSK